MSFQPSRPVEFKFQISDLKLFSISLPLQTKVARIGAETPPGELPLPPKELLSEHSQGFLIRSTPIASKLPVISSAGEYLRYVPLQYHHSYIDLGLSFDTYQAKFSSKTRSTIKRKVRKFEKHCGGQITWRAFSAPDEVRDFFRLAREVSQKTYQERLLDAGIPDSEHFVAEAESLAADDRLRAYVLFDAEKPISYLYCPVNDGVLDYSYLGYDPDYINLSVGTVLQWLALEQLFAESRFRFFDFTEGQSQHKRLFSTHQTLCAHVYFLRRTVRNAALLRCHHFVNCFSVWLGDVLDRAGLKARARRLLRFGARH